MVSWLVSVFCVSFLLSCFKCCSEALRQERPDQGSNVWPSADRMCTHTLTHSAYPLAAEGDYGSGWQMNSRLVWSKDQASSQHSFKSRTTYLFHVLDYGRSMGTKRKQNDPMTQHLTDSAHTSQIISPNWSSAGLRPVQMFNIISVYKSNICFLTSECEVLVNLTENWMIIWRFVSLTGPKRCSTLLKYARTSWKRINTSLWLLAPM